MATERGMWQPLEAGGSKERFSQWSLGKSGTLEHLDFTLLTFRTVKEKLLLL